MFYDPHTPTDMSGVRLLAVALASCLLAGRAAALIAIGLEEHPFQLERRRSGATTI